MAGINTIQFTRFPVQEMKLNLFADYYRYYVHFCGMFGQIELDNPLSITQKLIFQLEYNRDAKCVTNVMNHFGKLNTYTNRYWKPFSDYKAVISIYKQLQKVKKPYKYIDDNLEEILAKLSLLEKGLSRDMLRKSAEQIKTMILCDHEAEKHLEGIIFHTKIIASEVIMLRHSKQEPLDLFTEIMTRNYKLFPYPGHIKTDKEKLTYFNKKGIRQTLDAIIHFCETPQKEWSINFKIEKLVFPQDYVFNFDKTKIFAARHVEKALLIARTEGDEDPLIRNYFNGDDFSIAEVLAESVSYMGAYHQALKQLSYATDYMEAILKKKINTDKQNYFFTSDGCNYGYYFNNIGNNVYHINEFDRQKLDDNAYQVFKRVSSVAEQYFLEFEPAYINARKNNHIDELWHYLEILHNDGTHKKNLKADISGALVLYDKKFMVSRIKEYLRNSLHIFNSNYKNIGLTQEEQIEIVRREVDISVHANKIKSVFFRHAYKEMKTRQTKYRKKVMRDAYYSLVEEAYEHRNLIAHCGKFNSRADTKLSNTFPLMVIRYRWIIFDYIKRFPKNNLKQILRQIKNDIQIELGEI